MVFSRGVVFSAVLASSSLAVAEVPRLFSRADLPSISNCGSAATDLLTLTSLTVNPDPVHRGDLTTITVVGVLKEEVTDGAKMRATVKLGPIKLVEAELDLCEQIKSVGKSCPLPKGDTVVSHTFTVPAEVPPGRYTAHIDLYTADKQSIACVNANVRF
ncbi:Phosphatidylglycerol/phosphatidylinositol transfer protein [Irineochytrium annulatum]|nr:Phosphatidylglycerol/phosphatidylinositol transfer protein [Irineochytrium annulatum]